MQSDVMAILIWIEMHTLTITTNATNIFSIVNNAIALTVTNPSTVNTANISTRWMATGIFIYFLNKGFFKFGLTESLQKSLGKYQKTNINNKNLTSLPSCLSLIIMGMTYFYSIGTSVRRVIRWRLSIKSNQVLLLWEIEFLLPFQTCSITCSSFFIPVWFMTRHKNVHLLEHRTYKAI